MTWLYVALGLPATAVAVFTLVDAVENGTRPGERLRRWVVSPLPEGGGPIRVWPMSSSDKCRAYHWCPTREAWVGVTHTFKVMPDDTLRKWRRV